MVRKKQGLGRGSSNNPCASARLKTEHPSCCTGLLMCMRRDTVKQPTDQEQRKEDKKEEQLRNPSRVKEPEPDEPEGEIEAMNDQDPGERQKENQNSEKDDPLAA